MREHTMRGAFEALFDAGVPKKLVDEFKDSVDCNYIGKINENQILTDVIDYIKEECGNEVIIHNARRLTMGARSEFARSARRQSRRPRNKWVEVEFHGKLKRVV